MKTDYGNFTLSYIDSTTYYNYLGSKAFFLKTKDIFNQNDNRRAEFLATYPFCKQTSIARKDLVLQIRNNSSNLIKAYISNLLENLKTPSGVIYTWKNLNDSKYYNPLKTTIITISKYQNRLFTIIGLVLASYYLLSYRKNLLFSFTSLYIIYTILISGISCAQGDRFHIVTFPFVIILASAILSERIKYFQMKR